MLESDCSVPTITTGLPSTVASTVIFPFASVVTSAVPVMLSEPLLSLLPSLELDVSALSLSSIVSGDLVSAACSPSLPSTSSA